MTKPHVLYITRTGMLEALGQSQVLSYLRGLSQSYAITLISCERAEDLSQPEHLQRIQKLCKTHNIRWLPKRYRNRPKILAPLWEMLNFALSCWYQVRYRNAVLIHARSYVPAFVASIIQQLCGTPFIFDMRGLWAEELITAGRIKRGSWKHRMVLAMEKRCLQRAATTVSLTHAAVTYLHQHYDAVVKDQSIVVIPTCADLQRFMPIARDPSTAPIYSCLGSVLNGWFRIEWLVSFFQFIAAQDPKATFEIITQDSSAVVMSHFASLSGRVRVYSVAPHRVHEIIARHTASVLFYAGGADSELGRSPTRMGEVLGCGVPVIANRGVGDVADIIESHRVGVLLEDNTPAAQEVAWQQLLSLLADPTLSQRCRQTAQALYSLEAGTNAYQLIYQQQLSPLSAQGVLTG